MLSLREFAKIAKVSRTTVSNAFKKNSNISDATRARLLRLAKEYDFRPSPVMRPAARFGLTQSVGVLYPGFAASYFDDIRQGMQVFLLERGFLPITLAVRPDTLRHALNRLVDHRIDGLAVASWEGGGLTDEDKERLQKLALPLVALGPPFPPGFPLTDNVGTDDVQGGRLAAQHLLQLGHRRVAALSITADVRVRAETFRNEIERGGGCIQEPPPSEQTEYGQLHALFDTASETERPTAVFANTDISAARVYQVASELGLHIPADLSVIGYANLDFARILPPPLTTICQDGRAVGAKAGEYIVERIEGCREEPRQYLVP
ncbi:MAG: LacI family transcriptional regulator, partial [Candidatus Pacebacteria bacterium]|nr:LacI family transcriptional regulator [Candidatus Paceibacterota bacterium]